jgi:phosphohistidine swiveling domain-containing protein
MTPATWLPAPSHSPEQMTPLSATTWFHAVGIGLHEAMRELHGPFGGFEAVTELGWAYEGELGLEWEPDPDGLRAAALELPERWERELRPRAHEITDALHELRPESPSPAAALAAFDGMWKLVLEQWKIHFLAVIPAQIGAELFHDRYVATFGGDDPLAPYRWLQGPSETTEADSILWQLAQRARDLGVADIVSEHPVGAAIERLRELRHGRRFLAHVDEYLSRFGGRSRWHEVSLPREVERPHMTFESLRLFIEHGMPPRERRPKSGPDLPSDLAELLPIARSGYALKESHVYHIDYPGLLALREVLLGFGRRLTAEGMLDGVDDLWMLRRDELRRALDSDEDVRPVAQRRRDELAQGLVDGPKRFLGDPPATAERHAALEKFYGHAGGPSEGRTIRGTGASPGRASGRARVVRGPDDFRRVRSGDVLVATTTTPAWTPLFPSLAGLVTETGGILSHAAIVAREYGIPTVVGVEDATTVIPEDAILSVDGDTGDVTMS